MKRFVFGFVAALVAVCLVAGAPFVRTNGDPQIEGNVTIHGDFTTTGTLAGNETEPDVDPGGMCLNQGTGDLNIFTLKSDDVAHGITTIAEMDTFAFSKKVYPDGGGLNITGLSDDNAGVEIVGIGVASVVRGLVSFVAGQAQKAGATYGDVDDLKFLLSITNNSTIKSQMYGNGDFQTDGDLIVDGGLIGVTADLDLISMAADALTINGSISASGDLNAPSGSAMQLGYWYQDDVAASQTAVVLDMDGNASRSETPIVRAGSVIGVAVYSNEARTAGTLTVDVTIDGAATGVQAVLDGINTQTHTATQAKDTDAFTAGQRIGVKLTTDGAWLPVTADLTVSVLIEQ